MVSGESAAIATRVGFTMATFLSLWSKVFCWNLLDGIVLWLPKYPPTPATRAESGNDLADTSLVHGIQTEVYLGIPSLIEAAIGGTHPSASRKGICVNDAKIPIWL